MRLNATCSSSPAFLFRLDKVEDNGGSILSCKIFFILGKGKKRLEYAYPNGKDLTPEARGLLYFIWKVSIGASLIGQGEGIEGV